MRAAGLLAVSFAVVGYWGGTPGTPPDDSSAVPTGFVDCNDNGIDDGSDIASGTSVDCNGNGIPDECDVVVQFTPIPGLGNASDVGDIDGDGDLDILWGGFWFENLDGLGNFGPGQPAFGGTPPFLARLADLDRDADLDTVRAFSPSPDDVVTWSENIDGNGLFEGEDTIFSTGQAGQDESILNLFTADVDDDGDNDVFVHIEYHESTGVSEGWRIWLIKQAGAGSFLQGQIAWANGTLSCPASCPRYARVADLDGDGDPDLLWHWTRIPELAWAKNSGFGVFFSPQVIDTGEFSGIEVADLDGDQRLDVITSSTSLDEIAWYPNLGAGNFGAKQVLVSTEGTLLLTDVDYDGDTDLVSFYDNRLVWHENLGIGSLGPAQILASPPPYLPLMAADLNGDGPPDILGVGGWYRNEGGDCNHNGIPDDCDPDCNANGVADVCEPDCNGNGVADGCDIDTGSSADCDTNNVPDECQPDCNANEIADACEPDCNLNGVADECDLDDGAPDCNGNEIPDECEPDCNDNGQADECDLSSGFSGDCNENTVPDECEGLDDDHDLVCLGEDNCPDDPNPDQLDTDADGLGDACDNCAATPNADQLDDDSDSIGNECDPCPQDPANLDTDDDGICDNADNCPSLPNPEQSDGDESGLGEFGPKKTIYFEAVGATHFDQTVFAPDLDGDGDLDVFSTLGNKIVWFENLDGDGDFGTQRVIGFSGSGAGVVALADIDGDSDIDVLTRGSTSEPVWYENLDGAGNFGPEQTVSSDIFGLNSVLAADVDGDDDLDLVTAAGVGWKVAWCENLDGAGNFGPPTVITVDTQIPGALLADDLDGDLDLDLLYSSGFGSFWYENTDGAGSFSLGQNFATEQLSMFTLDVDGDVDADLLVFSGVLIAWYKNLDGSGNFALGHLFYNTTPDVSSVFVEDINLDGKPDVLATLANSDKVGWFKHNGGPFPYGPFTMISADVNAPRASFAADVDQDGDPDVLVASSDANDEIAWYENGGPDEVGDLCDLDDGLIYVTLSSQDEIQWQDEVGFNSWNLYAGDLDVLRNTGVYTQSPGSNPLASQHCGLVATFGDTGAIPASGKAAFFLTTGVSAVVESGLGTDSSGQPRPNDNPCP